jgi:arylsulfatase A-like enzyme
MAGRPSASAEAPPANASAGPPNIVLIVFDDLGWGDLPSQHGGDPGYRMPAMARLEREGTRFTSFLVSQPVCSASRASILTGCYADRVGITGALGPGSPIGLHPDETTVAELAAARGLATAGFGKWHLGDADMFLPVRHGFDVWYGIPYSNDMWSLHPESPRAWPRGVPLVDARRDPATGAVTVETSEVVTMHDQARLTGELTARATAFVREQAAADRPFFLYLAHPQPHVPLAAGPSFRGRTARGLFGDVMEELDWSVGEVLRTLDETGTADRTLVIVTSDNGPWLSYGDHAGSSGGLREGKGTTFEGGVRVPCLVRWPGVVPAGRVDDVPWMTIDLLPTIAEAMGESAPGGEHATGRPIDGRSAMSLLRGDPGAASPNEAYLHYYHRGALEAVRSGRWKLHLPHAYRSMDGQPVGRGGIPGFYRQRRIEGGLFDLGADRREQRDVSATEAAALARLEAMAEAARADLGDTLTGRPGPGRRDPGRVNGDD